MLIDHLHIMGFGADQGSDRSCSGAMPLRKSGVSIAVADPHRCNSWNRPYWKPEPDDCTYFRFLDQFPRERDSSGGRSRAYALLSPARRSEDLAVSHDVLNFGSCG